MADCSFIVLISMSDREGILEIFHNIIVAVIYIPSAKSTNQLSYTTF